ncbi:WXG100 family type VII secretion target [Streptomyces tubercidicus]|uniref:WXG100 family type VII secretion target n=1 Tax=Streptomyces tubercidicus TaxID=47759 RepID=UPI00379B4C1E
MSGDESAAEQVYEAGLEIINPGGEPEVLRAAAKGWRDLHENLQTMFKDMDREVQRTVDSHWQGPAADAFAEHWKNLDAAMGKTLPQLPAAAKSLDEAAEAIEEINSEIHEIYLEIGISIGISVGLSFLTMGFSAAAGAARAAQLATKAAKLAKTLGTILRKVGQAFQTVSRLAKEHRFLKNVLVTWASNTGSTVMANSLMGKETDIGEAVWQGGLSSVAGTGPALGIGKAVGGMRGAVLGGAAGNVTGGLAVDGARTALGEHVSGDEFLGNALVNSATGGAGGAAVHAANGHLPAGHEGPHFSVDGIINGTVYGVGGVAGQPLKDALTHAGEESKDTVAPGDPAKKSVRDVFG